MFLIPGKFDHLQFLYWMQVVPDAGHSANEVGIAAELRSATEKLRDMLRK